MSISELFDHGAPHPWANLRLNNVTVDGNEIMNTAPNPISPVRGKISNFSGTLRTTAPGPNTVFTYPFLSSPPQNTSVTVFFGFIVKGGPPGLTNNTLTREVRQLWQLSGGGIVSTGLFVVDEVTIGFVLADIAENIGSLGQSLVFQLNNTVAGQTADWVWYLKVVELTTTL